MSQLVFAQRQQVKHAMSALEDALDQLNTCYKDRCDQLQASVDSLTKIVETKDSTIAKLLKKIEQLTRDKDILAKGKAAPEIGRVAHKLSCVICCDFAYFFFLFFLQNLCLFTILVEEDLNLWMRLQLML